MTWLRTWLRKRRCRKHGHPMLSVVAYAPKHCEHLASCLCGERTLHREYRVQFPVPKAG